MPLAKRITKYFLPLGSLACWNFDGEGAVDDDLKDRTSNAFDLAWASGSAAHITLPGGMTGMRFDNNKYLIAPASEALRIAKEVGGGGDASLTIEVLLGPGQTTNRIIGSWASGESYATNYLYDLFRRAGSPDYWGSFNEYGNGSNIDLYYTSCPEASPLDPDYWPRYVALTVSADGTERICHVNNVGDAALTTHTHTTTAAQKNTSGNAQRTYIGVDFTGTILGIRMWNVTKSPAEVQALHDALHTEFGDNFHEREEPVEFPTADEDIPTQAMWEDAYALPGAGGPLHHTFPQDGRGQFMPGPETQEADAPHGTPVQAMWEDAYDVPTAGGPPRTTATEVGEVGAGVFMPGPPSQPQRGPVGPDNVGAWEDVLRYLGGVVPEFSAASFDVDGKPHFTVADATCLHAFYYNATQDPWHTPTANNFTGYARNGKHYTNGSEDAGPVWAPWATEGSSDHRGTRQDFPLHALIVTGRYEVVIFDLDSYTGAVNSLKVWMRFYWNDADYMSLGRGALNIRDTKFANGTLICVSRYDSSPATNGGIFTIDFKANDQSVFHLMRADGTWNALAGRTIVNRNDVNPWNSLGGNNIDSEYIFRLDFRIEGTDTLYLLHVGDETPDPQVTKLVNNSFVESYKCSGDDVGQNDLNDEWYKFALFDEQGWLWSSRQKRIYRHGNRYAGTRREGIHQNAKDRLRKHIDLPHEVISMVAARDRIYVGTVAGVYIVERGSMEYWLGYTAVGGGGKGRLSTGTTQGELLKAAHSESYRLHAISLSTASYLGVAQTYHRGGAVTVIRLYDDFVVGSYEAPDLTEDGAFFAAVTPA